MRSLSSLIHDALFPSTRVYHDENGNYRGTSTDITPWHRLIGRIWGISLWLYLVLLPLLAPLYFLLAHWYCRKYDAINMKEDPKGWPKDKASILKNHRNILIGWIIFIAWGYFSDWGGDDLPYKYTQPSQTWKESTWDPEHPELYEDPYKEYKNYK